MSDCRPGCWTSPGGGLGAWACPLWQGFGHRAHVCVLPLDGWRGPCCPASTLSRRAALTCLLSIPENEFLLSGNGRCGSGCGRGRRTCAVSMLSAGKTVPTSALRSGVPIRENPRHGGVLKGSWRQRFIESPANEGKTTLEIRRLRSRTVDAESAGHCRPRLSARGH